MYVVSTSFSMFWPCSTKYFPTRPVYSHDLQWPLWLYIFLHSRRTPGVFWYGALRTPGGSQKGLIGNSRFNRKTKEKPRTPSKPKEKLRKHTFQSWCVSALVNPSTVKVFSSWRSASYFFVGLQTVFSIAFVFWRSMSLQSITYHCRKNL